MNPPADRHIGTPLRRVLLVLAAVSALLALLAGLGGFAQVTKPATAVACIGLAFGIGAFPHLRGYQFTCWIVCAFVVAMLYPDRFLSVGPFLSKGPLDLRHPWLILAVVQLVMFGMGTQMRIADLAGVAKAPHAVGVGLLCQFTIMPLLGIGLARLFGLPDAIAAGVVLIGSCSSGLASNVMVFMANGNLALSVTLTTVATLLAPLITPTWMQLLAGELVEVDFVGLMLNIIKIVIVPIGAAFVHDFLRTAGPAARRVVVSLAVVSALWIAALVMWQWQTGLPASGATTLVMSGFLCGTVLAGTLFHALVRCWPRLEPLMPFLSMFGIVYFTLVTTAAGRDALLSVGVTLFFVAVLHNALGYCFGYGLSRMLGLDAQSARTVALEVGLQNGGMASGLAGAMGKLGTVGLAAAIFSPWMNVSGSILANYWRKRPVNGPTVDEDEA